MITTWLALPHALTLTVAQFEGQSSTTIISDELGLWDWLGAAIIFVSGVIIANIASRIVRHALRGTNRSAVARLVGRFVSFVIMVIAFVYSLNSIDVQIGPLLGFIGVGGIALAFALQEILGNFIAGILLQLRTPFWIGDQIRTNDVEGTVEDIGLRDVTIRTFDGRRVVVPSSAVLKNVIDNDTAFDHRRSEIPVGVAYDSPVARARQIILEAARTSSLVLPQPEPAAYVTELGASAIVFSLHIWHKPERAEEWKVIDDVIERVKTALDDADIGIPFDQLTLHVAEPVRVLGADRIEPA